MEYRKTKDRTKALVQVGSGEAEQGNRKAEKTVKIIAEIGCKQIDRSKLYVGRVEYSQSRQYYRSRKVLWRRNDDSMLHPAYGSDYSLSCTIMAPDETVATEATTETPETEVDTEETSDESEEDEEDDEEDDADDEEDSE